MKVTIARKFGALGAMFTAGGILAMALFDWFIERTGPESAFIYLAAQLRMTAQELLLYADGHEALRLAEQQKFDLLVTDVVMPGLQGPEVARRLLKHRPDLKVLYRSGYAGDLIAERGLLPAERSFLQKPFTMQQVLAAVRRALGG